MKNLAIIPARSGSKRIEGKNVRHFLGRPIIAYSIQAALSSGLFDEVMVSTDDHHIASIARQCGASVPFMRSENTSNDYAGLAEVLAEVVGMYEDSGEYVENVCCVLATAPLVRGEDLYTAYGRFMDGGFDSLYPVVRFSYPILRSLRMDDDGRVAMRWPEYYDSRSQDLEPAYHDSGTFYWIRTDALKTYSKLVTPNSGAVEIDELRAQDIDNEQDWILAEMKYRMIYGAE